MTTTTTTTTLPQTGTWTFDPAHTRIGFMAKHLMVTKVRGSFGSYSGTIEVADPIETSSVEVSIDAASLDTGYADRDNHLRSADFLDVENHPNLSFRSTGVRGAGRQWTLDGELTIAGVTRPVHLDVAYEGIAADPWGGNRAGFTATTQVNREDFGLTWNAALETGGFLVGKNVTIELEVELVRQ